MRSLGPRNSVPTNSRWYSYSGTCNGHSAPEVRYGKVHSHHSPRLTPRHFQGDGANWSWSWFGGLSSVRHRLRGKELLLNKFQSLRLVAGLKSIVGGH